MCAEASTCGTLVALAAAVLLCGPALAWVVALLTWTAMLSPTARAAFAQPSAWLGALPVTEQLPPPLCESTDQEMPLPGGSGSLIETFAAELAPSLATVTVKPTRFPAGDVVDVVPLVSAVLVMTRFAGPTSLRVAHSSFAPLADTHAVSSSLPASTSACVAFCEPVHAIEALGASAAGISGEHLKPSSAGLSLTETELSVTLPVLVATIS